MDRLRGRRYPLHLLKLKGQRINVDIAGDVGVIDEYGQFQRFFNVTVDENHPYNQRGVPPGFERLKFDTRLIAVNPYMLHPGAIPSNSVKCSKVAASLVGYVNS